MTICIAAIAKAKDEQEIVVFATDHMISIPQIGQFEKTIEKYKMINKCTVAMLSGAAIFFDEILKGIEEEKDFDEVKKSIQENMKKKKEDMIKKQMFDIYKIDYDYVKKILAGPLQNRYIRSIIDNISKFTLKTQILLVGFKGNNAQIVEITETRMIDLRDINFSAIGSGAIQAINTLLFQRHSKKDSLTTGIYNVYKAKRNAEVSIGVGKETDVLVLTKKGVVEVNEDLMNQLSKIYDKELKYGKTNKKLFEMVNALVLDE